MTRPQTVWQASTRAIAIDLDGTLLDTINDLSGAANRTLRALGLPEIPLEVLRTFVGKGKAMHVRRSLAAAMGREATEPELVQAMEIYEQEYFAHIDDTTVAFAGVREGLNALHAKRYPLACVTNKARAFTMRLLERQNLLGDFQLVLGGDELARSKPDPMMLEHTAQHFHVPTAQLLMIGDSGNDAHAARAAGCPIALMSYGYTEGESLANIPNDGIFSSFIEIAALLPPLRVAP
jgi:phosphoglycolate phosphatase